FLGVGKEFYDRRFPFAVFDFDEGESFGAERLCYRSKLVRLADRDAGEILRIDPFDHATAVERTSKNLEFARREHVAETHQLHTETAVGFVTAERAHCLAVGQARKRGRNVN